MNAVERDALLNQIFTAENYNCATCLSAIGLPAVTVIANQISLANYQTKPDSLKRMAGLAFLYLMSLNGWEKTKKADGVDAKASIPCEGWRNGQIYHRTVSSSSAQIQASENENISFSDEN